MIGVGGVRHFSISISGDKGGNHNRVQAVEQWVVVGVRRRQQHSPHWSQRFAVSFTVRVTADLPFVASVIFVGERRLTVSRRTLRSTAKAVITTRAVAIRTQSRPL